MITENSDVRQVLRLYSEAVQAKDIEALVGLFAEDVVTFDLMLPFRYSGTAPLRERLARWFGSYEGPINHQFDETQVAASGDLAVVHSLVRTRGQLNAKGASDMWTRSTIALRRSDGAWRIFHGHTSDPIDMKTGRAIFQKSA